MVDSETDNDANPTETAQILTWKINAMSLKIYDIVQGKNHGMHNPHLLSEPLRVKFCGAFRVLLLNNPVLVTRES